MSVAERSLSSAVLETIRRELDNEIAALERDSTLPDKDQIRALRTKRNLYTAVAQLPNEIICDIFLELRNNKFQVPYFITYRPAWIGLTHVCRSWRAVALDHPQLWSDITDDMSLSWVPVFIKRSKQVPVSLRLKHRALPKDIEAVVCDLLSQTSRLQSLAISGPPGLLRERIARLTYGAPLLNHLTIDCYQHHWEEYNSNPDIPRNFLNGGTPLLQTLRLTNCRLSWDVPLLERLTAFHYSFGADPSPSLDFDRILSTLTNMPHLVDLSLTRVLPDEAPSAKADYAIYFADLQRVSLSGHLYGCSILLNHISIPPSADVKLALTHPSDIGVAAFVSVLPSIFPSRRSHQFQSLSIDPSDYGFFARLWRDRVDFKIPRRQISPMILFMPYFNREEMTRIICALPLEGIRHLDIVDEVPIEFGPILERLTTLEDVNITPNMGPALVKCLKDNAQSLVSSLQSNNGQRDASSSLYLPQLKVISFERDVFYGVPEIPIPIVDLEDAIRSRATLGAKIKKIIFIRDNIGEGQVERLEQFVDNVETID